MPRKTLIQVFAILTVLAIGVGTFISLGGGSTVSESTAEPTPTATPTATSAPSTGEIAALPAVTNKWGEAPVITAPTGAAPATLQAQDIIAGTGTVVSPTSTLTVHYTLMSWSSGEVLESSWSRGETSSFPLANVVAGWQQGLPGAQVGGRRLLVVPPSLGYGPAIGHPLEKETLIFVVDIIAVS
jgi:peptidylprolyl isomerase